MLTTERRRPARGIFKRHDRAADVGWRFRLHEIIFEADTRGGKLFDVALMLAIVASVAVVMIESLPDVESALASQLLRVEWAFTILFTIEYFARIAAVKHPSRYIFSFFGMVDLLAILPTWISLVLPGGQPLIVIRALRLIRVFRVLKLGHYLVGAEELSDALRDSRPKIIVFLAAVASIAVVMGALLYLIEGEENGFTSIPRGVYWAIVTMTTVGYGDISPQTVPGQFAAMLLMLTGYAIIAVPTGIVSAAIARRGTPAISTQACLECSREGHDPDAGYCKFCGAELRPEDATG
ncbi:MAG: ion transporter [Acidobacteria bacterium]|nr:ion transporter [Acidobacteriota bacterium]